MTDDIQISPQAERPVMTDKTVKRMAAEAASRAQTSIKREREAAVDAALTEKTAAKSKRVAQAALTEKTAAKRKP